MLTVLGLPHAARAEADSAEWFEMAHACEQVIVDQSFHALSGYEAAPFSTGKPGVKEYAVFSGSHELVVTARVEHEEWTRCLIGLRDRGDRSRWQEIAPLWNAGFETAFPPQEYVWVQSKVNHYMPFVGAFRCEGQQFVLAVNPYLGSNLDFFVEVTSRATETNAALCLRKSG